MHALNTFDSIVLGETTSSEYVNAGMKPRGKERSIGSAGNGNGGLHSTGQFAFDGGRHGVSSDATANIAEEQKKREEALAKLEAFGKENSEKEIRLFAFEHGLVKQKTQPRPPPTSGILKYKTGEAFMSCFDDDDDKERKSKKRKEEAAPPTDDDDSDDEGSDGEDDDDDDDDDGASSSSGDDEESYESESESESESASEEDERGGGKQKAAPVVVASVPRSALGGGGGRGNNSSNNNAASFSLPQIDRKRFMSSKTSEVAAEVSGRGEKEGDRDGSGRHRDGKRGLLSSSTSTAAAANGEDDESSRLPTREEFSRMQRDVEELGAIGLDKRSRKNLEERRLAALGFSPLQPRPRVPASIGFGQAAARRKHAAATLEAALDEGLVQQKGLSKKRKKEKELEDEFSAGKNKRKKARARESERRGLNEEPGVWKGGVLQLRGVSAPSASRGRGGGRGARGGGGGRGGSGGGRGGRGGGRGRGR